MTEPVVDRPLHRGMDDGFEIEARALVLEDDLRHPHAIHGAVAAHRVGAKTFPDRGEPRTLEEVGEIFNLTRERIRQIEAKAMSKLRHPSVDIGARELLPS